MAGYPYYSDYTETYTTYEEVHTEPSVQYVEHIQVVQPQVVQPVVQPVVQTAPPVYYAPSREPYVALSQIPYTGLQMGSLVSFLNILLLLGVSLVLAYTLTIYLPRYGGSLRRMLRHFWRNELARELDVDEEVHTFFEQELSPPPRKGRTVVRRKDFMTIQSERGEEPPRIIIART